MVAITLSAVAGAFATVLTLAINSMFSFVKHFGYLPFVLFMMGILFLDINTNFFGGLITLGTSFFWGFQISSFVLFMLTVTSVIIWFFWKVKDFVH